MVKNFRITKRQKSELKDFYLYVGFQNYFIYSVFLKDLLKSIINDDFSNNNYIISKDDYKFNVKKVKKYNLYNSYNSMLAHVYANGKRGCSIKCQRARWNKNLFELNFNAIGFLTNEGQSYCEWHHTFEVLGKDEPSLHNVVDNHAYFIHKEDLHIFKKENIFKSEKIIARDKIVKLLKKYVDN